MSFSRHPSPMDRSSRHRFRAPLAAWCALPLLAGLVAGPGLAARIGAVADNGSSTVTFFDADSDTVIGSVALGSNGGVVGDCLVHPDQKLAFVTDYAYNVWVIDLSGPAPALAAGTNPIAIANPGEDLSLSPDKKFLVVSDGGSAAPLAVIDIAARAQVSTFSTGADADHTSVDVARDGSVLVTSMTQGKVHRLTLDPDGLLFPTGEVLGDTWSRNVYHAPGNKVGVAVTAGRLGTFSVPGLAPMSSTAVSGSAVSAAFSPAGDRVFVRTLFNGLRAFSLDPDTGALGAAPVFSIPAARTTGWFGIDQVAVHPSGTKLYVPDGTALKVYSPSTGTLITSIPIPGATQLSGVDIAAGAVNQPPAADAQSVTAAEDTAKAVTLTGSDPDSGDTLAYSVVDEPEHGTLSGTAPNLTYTPDEDYAGSDAFAFKINDGTVDSDVATVSITVTPVNDAPVADGQSKTTAEDTPVPIIPTGSDVDAGDTLTYGIQSQPGHGTLSANADGTFTYTPDANYHGADSFSFTASDGTVTSTAATVSITVNPVNDNPVANAGADQTLEATGPQTQATLDGSGSTDVEDGGDLAKYEWSEGADPLGSGKTLPVNLGVGVHAITLKVTDAGGATATDTVAVTVTDKTPPVISGVPADTVVIATGAAGAAATFAAPAAADLVDGSVAVTLSTASGPVASGAQFPLGKTIVTATATDAAGNTATATFVVWVRYAWSGVLQPVNADGSSVFRLGRTVPVKFKLAGASAGITDAAATFSFRRTGTNTGAVNEPEVDDAPTTGGTQFRYDAGGGQYVFNWDTKATPGAGTYELTIDLGDGVTRTVELDLR